MQGIEESKADIITELRNKGKALTVTNEMIAEKRAKMMREGETPYITAEMIGDVQPDGSVIYRYKKHTNGHAWEERKDNRGRLIVKYNGVLHNEGTEKEYFEKALKSRDTLYV